MFSNALFEIQKEYGAMRDSLPAYASYTKVFSVNLFVVFVILVRLTPAS